MIQTETPRLKTRLRRRCVRRLSLATGERSATGGTGKEDAFRSVITTEDLRRKGGATKRKVNNLKVKAAAHDRVKNVKGGPSMGPWRKHSLASRF